MPIVAGIRLTRDEALALGSILTKDRADRAATQGNSVACKQLVVIRRLSIVGAMVI
jgi:hypothetical protein